jgi:hypothetical protein
MTPEERAMKIGSHLGLVRDRVFIADEIRAAENDALERAALELDELPKIMASGSYPCRAEIAGAYQYTAIKVRALKHKETT